MLRLSCRALLCMLLILCLGCAAAPAEEVCKYWSAESTCEIIWWVDTEARTHSRACKNHVEDKEDAFSYVVIDGPYPCSLDAGGTCTVCGWDYVRDSSDDEYMNAFMMEILAKMIAEGETPVELSASAGELSIEFTDEYFEMLEAMGVSASESMNIPTTYTLSTQQSAYPYTGSPVTPAHLAGSEYGPASFLLECGFLTISGISYENNVLPGTASASVVFSVKDSVSETLTTTFTITGGAGGGDDEGGSEDETVYCKYGSADSPCDLKWQVDSKNRTHTRVCTAHVEDKDDMYSYVVVSGPDACTPDENETCTVCGKNYGESGGDEPGDPTGGADYDLFYTVYNVMQDYGYDPVVMEIKNGKMHVSLSDRFFAFYDERGAELGIYMPESMYAETVYDIVLEDGSEYPYTGSPVTPAHLAGSEYGPASFLLECGFLTISGISYENNVLPGTATASVTFSVKNSVSETLTTTFTITGGAGGGDNEGGSEDETVYCKYGSADSPCDLKWQVDSKNRTHTRVCTAHVEDKDDMYSYVVVSGPDACTPDENETCTVCGKNYGESGGDEPGDPTGGADYDLFYTVYNVMQDYGYDPVVMEIKNGKMHVSLSDRFFAFYDERGAELGIYMPESMYAETVYDIVLEDGSEYPYTGSEIIPNAHIKRSEYGPGAMLEAGSALNIDNWQYIDNIGPGAAQITVDFSAYGFSGYTTKTLSKDFTITGGAGGGDDGDDDGGNVGVSWPLDTRTMLSLPAETLEIRAESFTRISAASVMIPASCESVGASAFADSPALTAAVFLGADTVIDATAFSGCTGLTIIAPAGSTAQAFAQAQGFAFMVLPQ